MPTGHRPTVPIDADGIIADSLPAIAHGFRLALEVIDHPLPPASFINTIPDPLMVGTLTSLGLPDEQVDRAFAMYMEHQHAGAWQRAKTFPGWPELPRDWRAADVQLATATSKDEYFARKTLDNFGLLDASDLIGATSDDGPRQIKTEVTKHTLKELGVGTDETVRPLDSVVMVGDRIHDFEGAVQFGIPAIAVRWGYGSESEWASVTAVASSPEDLNRVVRKMLYP